MSSWKFHLMVICSLVLTGMFIPGQTGFAQELPVDFEDQLTIGDREDAPKEYLFGGPRFIETDSKYNIYVATMNNSIRIYDPDGNYRKTIGRRGRGPGEFLAISGMTIGIHDELIIYDGRSRHVSVFYNTGDSLKSYNASHPAWMGGTIFPMEDGERFVTASLEKPWIYQYTGENDALNLGDSLLHIVNNSFLRRIRSYYKVSNHMFDRNIPIETYFSRVGYEIEMLNDSTIALTNQIYDGSIYFVNLKNGVVDNTSGHFTGRESYEVLDWDNKFTYAEERAGIVIIGGNQQVVLQKKLESRALLTNDKWGLNFVQTANGSNSSSYMEFISREGSYLGYTPIHDDFVTMVDLKQKFYPMHLDDQNQLYYVDYSSGVPVIRVTKITLNW